MVTLPILILAAGASRRMRGADKLLETIEGEPLLTRTARRALAMAAPVYVALPVDHAGKLHQKRAEALAGLALTRVPAPEAERGMAHSLRAGLNALAHGADGVLVLLADMPDLTSGDLRLFFNAFEHDPKAIYRAAAVDGTFGHPVVFPAALFADLIQLEGDQGARAVIEAHEDLVRQIPLPGRHALTDLDTPEDWAEWRKRHKMGDA